MPIYFGIDCGYAAPGFAIVDAYAGCGTVLYAECFRTKGLSKKQRNAQDVYKSHDDARRCITVSDEIKRLVEIYDPDYAVVELPSAGAKSATAIKGMALGAATTVVTLHRLDVPVLYITPGANKRGSTDDRNAQKDAVKDAVQKIWPAFNGWPKLKKKNALDREACWAVADALSTIYTYLKNG